jgi:hypothetical protein
MRDKVGFLNHVLISKYNNIFTNMLFDEKCQNIEIRNMDDFGKKKKKKNIYLIIYKLSYQIIFLLN